MPFYIPLNKETILRLHCFIIVINMGEDLKDFADKAIEFKSQCLAMIKSIHGEDNQLPNKITNICQQKDADNISTATRASFIDKEEIDQQKVNIIDVDKRTIKLVTSELGELSKITEKLRLKLSTICQCQFDDPLFEVLKFLNRKQILHCGQLINHRLNKIITRSIEQWPKFKFGRLHLFTDDDLKRTTTYWMFKNRKELKAPLTELAPILRSMEMLDSKKEKIINPVQLMSYYSESLETEPKSIYLFVNVDENDAENEENFEIQGAETGRYFIYLPAKLDLTMAVASAIYWFRELSKVHFITVQFENYRWTNEFYNFLKDFAITKFLPINSGSFKCYNPISLNFLRNAIKTYSLITLWEIRGDIEFLRYIVGNQHENVTDEKRIPEYIRIYNFLAQHVNDSTNGGEMSFFDALIQHAKKSQNPCQIIQHIDLNFKRDPAQWIKIVPGMSLIYKCQTYKVDEEDGTENEAIEIRYRIQNKNGRKFEIRVECEPDMLGQQMQSFALISEDEEAKK